MARTRSMGRSAREERLQRRLSNSEKIMKEKERTFRLQEIER